jgi:phage protein U
MLLSLGQFVFGINTLAFDKLVRQSAWRHPAISRVGIRPARQSLGPGDDTISVSGVLAPEFRGTVLSLGELRKMADSGKAWALVGAQENLGAWVIESLQQTGTHYTVSGQPRRIEFDLRLAQVDDHRAEGSGGVDPWPDDGYWEW